MVKTVVSIEVLEKEKAKLIGDLRKTRAGRASKVSTVFVDDNGVFNIVFNANVDQKKVDKLVKELKAKEKEIAAVELLVKNGYLLYR